MSCKHPFCFHTAHVLLATWSQAIIVHSFVFSFAHVNLCILFPLPTVVQMPALIPWVVCPETQVTFKDKYCGTDYSMSLPGLVPHVSFFGGDDCLCPPTNWLMQECIFKFDLLFWIYTFWTAHFLLLEAKQF